MKNIDLINLTEKANKGLDIGLTNNQLREVVACLLALKAVGESAKLISTTARHGTVKRGTVKRAKDRCKHAPD